MRVLYDHQMFSGQTYGGISRYFCELIKRFPLTGDSTCEVAGIFSNNVYLNNDTSKGGRPFFPNTDFRGKVRLMRNINKIDSNFNIRKGDFDIFHPTYYETYFLDKIKDKPFILTFHDAIHEKFSDKYAELAAGKIIFDQKKVLLERASKVIAVSNTTKKDIMDLYHTPADKIEVIYLGNSLAKETGDTDRIVPEDYILFVGGRTLYKNFSAYITSVANLLIANQLSLVCAGGGGLTEDEMALIRKLGLEKLVIHKKIKNDGVLSNLYAHALFFVFPSLYEGFGIPVLEAFACDCPILSSNGGSLPEVAGEAALYFDPNDAHSMHASTEKLLNSKHLRDGLKAAGSSRLHKYSWDKTFAETFDVYKKAIS